MAKKSKVKPKTKYGIKQIVKGVGKGIVIGTAIGSLVSATRAINRNHRINGIGGIGTAIGSLVANTRAINRRRGRLLNEFDGMTQQQILDRLHMVLARRDSGVVV